MPAPDFPTLYDFEGQLETAWAAVFTTAGMTAYSQQATGDKTSAFLNLQATIGAGRREYYLKSGVPDANKNFDFVLEVQIVTNRTATSANATHATMRGKVRNLMERWLAVNTGGSNINASLTYLRILDMSRTGGSRGVDENQRFDITTETYGGVIQVKDDAWPT
jgi:hypothetical protein